MTEKMVDIEVDISDEQFLYVAKMAHERDITFNEMVNIIMEEYLKLEEEREDGKSDS